MTRLGDFLLIGLLFEAHCDFLKTYEAAQKFEIFGLPVIEEDFLNFHLMFALSKYGLLKVSLSF